MGYSLVFLTLLLAVLTSGRLPAAKKDKDQGKIVGGKPTTIEETSYQLSVRLVNRHICGASLIQSNIALTAAHCTMFPFLALQIYGGSTSVSNDGKVSQVLNVCRHPKYNASSVDYDVAVILFTPRFEFSPKIQNITLETDGNKTKPGDKVRITGWGTLKSGVSDAPDTLQEAEVNVISKEQCSKQYGDEMITDRMICLHGDNQDSCQGDSGGPAVAENRQVGIVSWGKECALPDYAGVYTNIANKEISDHIQDCVKLYNSYTFLP